jgi:hypothetical protein
MLVWDSEEARQVACCVAGAIQYGNGRRVKEDLCLSIVKKAHFLCKKGWGMVTIQLIADAFNDRSGTGNDISAMAG